VLQGVVDCENIFIFRDIGASILYHFLEDFESTILKPASFEGRGTEMPFIILGD
jgi:hypothetical protein